MRYLRAQNKDVAFICGSDEHGVAISIRAKKEGTTPQKLLINTIPSFEFFEQFGISFDNYSRTSADIHHETAAAFFKQLHEEDVFEVQTNEQFFDTEQTFWPIVSSLGPVQSATTEAYGDQ